MVHQFQLDYYLSKYQDHWLVRLNEVFDFGPLEQGCAAYHKGSGSGSAVTHPVPRLVRALLVKYLHDFSYRQTEEQINLNWIIRWFVGYLAGQDGPDHTTLCRFELWVLCHQPRLFFDYVLSFIFTLLPQERERLAIVDTFGMFVRGARTSIIELLRDLCRHLLAKLAQLAPAHHQLLLASLDQSQLFGQAGEKITPALNPQERAERLQQVVVAALGLQQQVEQLLRQPPYLPPAAETELRLWLAAITKVIADETTLEPGRPHPLRRPPSPVQRLSQLSRSPARRPRLPVARPLGPLSTPAWRLSLLSKPPLRLHPGPASRPP